MEVGKVDIPGNQVFKSGTWVETANDLASKIADEIREGEFPGTTVIVRDGREFVHFSLESLKLLDTIAKECFEKEFAMLTQPKGETESGKPEGN